MRGLLLVCSAVGNPHSIEALFTTVVVLVFDAIMNFDFTVQQKSNFEPEVIILTNKNFFFLFLLGLYIYINSKDKFDKLTIKNSL